MRPGLARVDGQEIGPQRLDLLFHGRPGSGAQSHHRDHGANADNHAQHREERAKRIRFDRAEGDSNRFHYRWPPLGWPP